MHGYDKYGSMYKDSEIHSPWVRGLVPRTEPIWTHLTCNKSFKIFFLTRRKKYLRKKKCIIYMPIKSDT